MQRALGFILITDMTRLNTCGSFLSVDLKKKKNFLVAAWKRSF